MSETPISAAQVRMAKAALGLSNPRLAEMTKLHRNTLNRAERGEGKPATFDHLKRFFEDQGVVFVPENGGPAGIRYAAPDSDSAAVIDPDNTSAN